MITIAVPAEGDRGEKRVALSPETAKKFTALGCQVRVQAGAGAGANFSDADYKEAGAKVEKGAAATLKGADIILTVRRPNAASLKGVSTGAILACSPFFPWNSCRASPVRSPWTYCLRRPISPVTRR
jgi:proton-translocating NAD(P)+ transhydrogenase subunit alpha